MSKLLDTIKRYMRSKGIGVKSPLIRKRPFAKPGACKIIEPYDLEVDFKEKAEEEAKLRNPPHKTPEQTDA